MMRRASIAKSEASTSMAMSMDDEGHVIPVEESGLFNEQRMIGEIPQYETRHVRHYFTDQE